MTVYVVIIDGRLVGVYNSIEKAENARKEAEWCDGMSGGQNYAYIRVADVK